MYREQVQMLRRIQELEFVAIELTLYLDTHPGEREPLVEYNRVTQELNALKRTYENRYGPLTVYGYSPSQYPWRWIEDPWPWEFSY
ncbi:spore coat protein CotJB [Zhaonella formicivorans]|uniref:spore coat protein CotJB n=1 Tax=Zhaonella formicivorans TaxID=2528593 RepID=UPI0010E19F67|nr:spore coat protein CotJB [Zhaonella formicivorans]